MATLEDLITETHITGPLLVKAVKALLPEAGIDEILDSTRFINLKRIFNKISKMKFSTPIHIVEELYIQGLTLEDAEMVLDWMASDDKLSNELKIDISSLLMAGSVRMIYKFIDGPTTDRFHSPHRSCPPCLPCLQIRKNTIAKTGRGQAPL
jgi:hypothetical protein